MKNKRLSKYFFFPEQLEKWSSEDFHDDVVGVFLNYAQGDLKKQLEAEKGEIKLKYLDYDWSLNDK